MLKQEKILFADQLRCVAALSVVFVHLCGGYWAWRDQIAVRIMAPVLNGPNSTQLTVVSSFDFGPFGVSLFFLISGFVIPFSLDKLGAGKFLLARALRIYPTYIACLAIGLSAAWLSSRYWNMPFTTPPWDILANAILINNYTRSPSFDMVNWTLAIELTFYVVMAILAVASLHRSVLAYFVVTMAIITATIVTIHAGAHLPPIRDLAFVPYMLIGTIFNMHMRGSLTTRKAVVSILVLSAAFQFIIVIWNMQNATLPARADSYQLNIALFAAAYCMRDKFKPNRVIDFVAKVSYPLYAVHPILGYASLRLLMNQGLPPVVALSITLVIVFTAAYVVHRLVEMPTMRLGKSFGRNQVGQSWTDKHGYGTSSLSAE